MLWARKIACSSASTPAKTLSGCETRTYNDSQGVWHAFIRNEFARSDQTLHQVCYLREDWETTGFCSSGEDPIRHSYAVKAVRPVR